LQQTLQPTVKLLPDEAAIQPEIHFSSHTDGKYSARNSSQDQKTEKAGEEY
jgi:hypothetical protein